MFLFKNKNNKVKWRSRKTITTTSSSVVVTTTTLLISIYFCNNNIIKICNGEYIFPELEWSIQACKDNGFVLNEFELCATIEFCKGSGHFDEGNGRMLQKTVDGGNDDGVSGVQRQMHYDDYSYYGSYYDNMGKDNDSSNMVPSEGSFGWRISGTKDCRSPGPIIRLSRGKKYGLFVNNTATTAQHGTSSDTTKSSRIDDTLITNLHLHGLHISGSGNADDVTRKVRPGDVAVYNITIPQYHMGGTFWYHPHYHGQTMNQIGGGAYGMLIVDDGTNIGTNDTNVISFMQNERILIMDNLRNKRQISANGIEAQGYVNGGDVYYLNKDEWYRFRLLHVNTDSHKSGADIQIGNNNNNECDVYPIAHDGILRFNVPKNVSQNKFFLSSSSRMDVAIRCHTNAIINADFMPIANIKINDNAVEPKLYATPYVNGTEQWQSTRPKYLENLRTRINVDISWEVQLQETSINKQHYDINKPLCYGNGMDFTYGSLNEWTLKGTTGHPYHLHMYPMQIVGDCGNVHDVGEYYDTIVVQTNDFSDHNRRCSVRLQLIDVAGHAIMHCHILQHEDQGSMGFINVVVMDPHNDHKNITDTNSTTQQVSTEIIPVQPKEPRFIYCGDENKNVTTCDEITELGICIPQMPMVHTMPNHGGSSNDNMDDEEMNMIMNTVKEIEEREGYYGERKLKQFLRQRRMS